MNPTNITDPRPLVWTVSLEVPNTYCLYVNGVRVLNNCSFDDFYPVYRKAAQG